MISDKDATVLPWNFRWGTAIVSFSNIFFSRNLVSANQVRQFVYSHVLHLRAKQMKSLMVPSHIVSIPGKSWSGYHRRTNFMFSVSHAEWSIDKEQALSQLKWAEDSIVFNMRDDRSENTFKVCYLFWAEHCIVPMTCMELLWGVLVAPCSIQLMF